MSLFDFIRNSTRMPKVYRDTPKLEDACKGRELLRENTVGSATIREGMRRGCKLLRQNKERH